MSEEAEKMSCVDGLWGVEQIPRGAHLIIVLSLSFEPPPRLSFVMVGVVGLCDCIENEKWNTELTMKNFLDDEDLSTCTRLGLMLTI